MSVGTTHVGLVDRLFRASGAEQWGVTLDAFTAALDAGVVHRLGPDAPADAVAKHLEGLHAADLGLACGCRAGNDGAWERFILEFRPGLYAAARAVAGDQGRDLADALYADLFGLPDGRGRRRSLLAYYHGRSRLLTWLRSVLAQRRVDRLRETARELPLDEAAEDGIASASNPHADPPSDPRRDEYVAMAQRAVDAALDALEPGDRLRLRLYYAEGLKLAAIGRLTGEHEATVSRRLDRLRRTIRADVERRLRAAGLDEAAVTECLAAAADAPELHLDRALSRVEDG